MMCAITVANLAGSFIPNLMDKIGVDPAVASGPFISTLSDLTSVLIYFNIAKLFMKFLWGHKGNLNVNICIDILNWDWLVYLYHETRAPFFMGWRFICDLY